MLLFKLKNICSNCFWFPLILLLVVIGSDVAKAQRNYATLSASGGAATITNLGNALGAGPNLPPSASTPAKISATGTTGALGGSSVSGYLELRFPANVPANTYVYVKVANLVIPSIASAITAEAYNGATRDAGTQGPAIVGGDGTVYFLVSGTSAFDRVRVTVKGGGGGLLNAPAETASADVYYAYYNGTTVTDCGQVIGTGWAGSLGGSVANPQLAIDGSTGTFSTLGPGALLSYVDQSFYFAGLSNTTDEVKLTLSSPPAALSVGLLNNVTISAYKGTSSTVLWSTGLGSVLSVDLLGLLGNGTPITISVAPGVQFDRVVVHFGSVLNLFSNLYIREIDRTSASPTFTTQNATICAGNTATLVATTPPAGYENRWYNAAADGTLLFTGNSFTTPVLTTTTTYYVARAKTGCPNESLRLPAVVTVNPLPTVAAITGTTTICANQTTQLSSTSTGGVWSSSDPTKATVNSSTGLVTGVAGGTTTITYRITDGVTGCTNAVTTLVTVKPVPALTSALNPAVCSSSAFSYTALSNQPGTTFSWTRAVVAGISNAAGSGTSTISENLLNTTTGPVNVTYIFTLSLNGCSSTTNVILKVNPKPGAPHILSQ